MINRQHSCDSSINHSNLLTSWSYLGEATFSSPSYSGTPGGISANAFYVSGQKHCQYMTWTNECYKICHFFVLPCYNIFRLWCPIKQTQSQQVFTHIHIHVYLTAYVFIMRVVSIKSVYFYACVCVLFVHETYISKYVSIHIHIYECFT